MSREYKSRYHDENQRIRAQVEAEIAFGVEMESHGIDDEQIMEALRLTKHQVNVMAHYLYGVNDEEPPPILAALLQAAKSAEAA